MSAYMVEDETINRVVEWLSFEIIEYPSLKNELEKASGIDTAGYKWGEALGQAMFQLNIAAVNDRYGDGEAEKFRPLDYCYTPAPAHGSEIQVLKSLHCWLYQCAEGEVMQHPLYVFFETVIESHLMRKIIRGLPEYQQADWG